MERNLFSLVTAGLVLSAAVLGWNQSSRAAFCSKCQDLMFIESEGKCIDCGAPTASAALKLCPKCSAKRHQCEHCLAATSEKDETATGSKPANPAAETLPSGDSQQSRDAQSGPAPAWTAPANSTNPAKPGDASAAQSSDPEINPSPPAAESGRPAPLEGLPESKPPAELPPDPVAPARLKPINPAKPGLYASGRWRYQLQIVSPGTRNEGRWGWLTYDGQKLPRGIVNDYYNTPWGPIFWVDVPNTAWGVHGWMPVPLTQNERTGRPLPAPRAMSAATPTDQGAVPPASPRVQTLEINKSHNGQLARLRVGNVLVIRLPGNPATGYRWQAAKTNSPAMRLTVRPQYSPPASAATQATTLGTYTFTFQAVQPGSGSIRLYYLRPDEPSRPRDSFAVGVSVSAASTAAARSAAATLPVASRGQ